MSHAATSAGPPVIGGDRALAVAQADAARVYRDLSGYRIQIVLEPDGWHIEFRGTKPFVAGGGPHYVIDPISGAILSKTYYQ